MNKQRRKAINDIQTALAAFKENKAEPLLQMKEDAIIAEQLEFSTDEIQSILEEEQESYDNMPEGVQQSTNGETSYAAICELEEAISELEEANSFFGDAMANNPEDVLTAIQEAINCIDTALEHLDNATA